MNVAAFVILIVALVLLAIAALYIPAAGGDGTARRGLAFLPAGVFLFALAWGIELLSKSHTVHF